MPSPRKTSPNTVDDLFAKLAKKTGKSVEEVKEVWSERAAIREYVGGMTRLEAELRAIEDTEWMLS
jgi:hypothetical protein